MLDPNQLTSGNSLPQPVVPVPSSGRTNRQPTPVAQPVETATTDAKEFQASANGSAAESQLRAMAAMVDLVSSLDGATGLENAADRLAGNLATYLGSKRLFVLWRKERQLQLSVIADTTSVNDDQEKRAQYRLVTAAGEEVIARGAYADWPPKDARDRHALLATGQLAVSIDGESNRSVSIHAVRLGVSTETAVGALLLTDCVDPAAEKFLRMIATPLSKRLRAIEQLSPSRLEGVIRSAVGLFRSEQRKVVVGVVVLIATLLLLPLRYTVRAGLELQPVEHRFVAVPFEGPLESSNVRPGDTVQQGDLLATINPREIDYALAGIRAELNRAVQEQKGMMAEHDTAGSKIAGLESDRLRLKSELLQYQRGNLEIRSPIPGVVVMGDLKQSEGMPLDRGQTLFEIAPLGKMVVELSVAEDDFPHVRPGMLAQFYVHALPGTQWSGTVDRIHPRAEIRDHDNVFIAEIHIDDPENVLRPGMSGRARIFSDRHCLIWNLFHKPYYALRRTVGW